jgi:hypothetical protein
VAIFVDKGEFSIPPHQSGLAEFGDVPGGSIATVVAKEVLGQDLRDVFLELATDFDVASRRARSDFVLFLLRDTVNQAPHFKSKLSGRTIAMVFHGEHAETELGDVKVIPTTPSIAFVKSPATRALCHPTASAWATLVTLKIIRCRSTEPAYTGESHVLQQRSDRGLRIAALSARAFDLMTDFAVEQTEQIVRHLRQFFYIAS